MITDLEEIKRMVEENQQTLELLTKKVKSMRRIMVWSGLYETLKIILIFVPLVVGYLYFQPQLNAMYSSMNDLLHSIQSLQQNSLGNANARALQELRSQIPSAN